MRKTKKPDYFSWISSVNQKYQILRMFIIAIGMPLMVLPARLERRDAETIENLIGSELVIFLLGMTMWAGSFYIISNKKISLVFVKIVISFLICMIASVLFYEASPFQDYPTETIGQQAFPIRALRMSVRGFFMAGFVIPSIFYFDSMDRKRKVLFELEYLKQENLAIQLTSLRQQVNPHFLFNSLNVLKSGAQEEWVKNYVIKLANIYRYILKHQNSQNLVKVAVELEFIQAYLYILKERFENGLFMNIELDLQAQEKSVPILALQVLVENAVKHNIISDAHPLHIHIHNDDQHLIVKNNLQRKRNAIDASEKTETGLLNLQDRYTLINQTNIDVIEESGYFTVKIPMIG